MRIADSLERMEVLLMKMVNPPITIRGILEDKETVFEFPHGTR